MKLTTIFIEGFRSIEARQEISIGSPTILAGHNDAGKSAVIDAVSYLLDGYKFTERDRTYGTTGPTGVSTRVAQTLVEGIFELSTDEQDTLQLPESIRIRRIVRESGETFELQSEEPTDENLRNLDAQKVDALKFRCETFGLSTKGTKSELVERLHEVALLAEKEPTWILASAEIRRAMPRPQRFDATSSQDPEQAILAALRTSYRKHLEDDDMKGSVKEITQKLETLVIKDAEELREHIKTKCSDIGDVNINPMISWDSGLKSTEISAKNDRGEEVHLTQSGAGRARRIALAVWEHNAEILGESGEDTVLLYDEPDTHLDYRHQRGFMRLLLEQAALPNVRIVVASHSMNLIDGVDISDVLHLKHVDSRTNVEKISDDSEVGRHLGAIAASLGLRNTVLLHERLFVGVEGATEGRALPVLFKLAKGRQLESCGIALWPCSNNEGALRFAEYLHSHHRTVIMAIDNDSLGLKQFSKQNLIKHGLTQEDHLITIGKKEFEDLFPDSQWAACANANWPRADGVPWEESHFSAHREKKFSSDVEKMLRAEGSIDISGKPDIMVAMALSLKSKEDIPSRLMDIFDQFVDLAA
ncbi:AAA family ATPase [Vibrio cholerae]|nr:AAA family ATPase [Vibrio cholerae]